MASLNKILVIGHLGQDPEMRTFPSGDQVANVSVATSERWKDKQSGEQREETTWHRVQFHGRLAEIAGEYLRKGSQVYVEGSLRQRSYEKDGATHYITEIRADRMQMLGDPKGSDDRRGGDRGGYDDRDQGRSQGGGRGQGGGGYQQRDNGGQRGGRGNDRGGQQQRGNGGGYQDRGDNRGQQRNDDQQDRSRGGGGGQGGYAPRGNGGGTARPPAQAPAPATGGDSGFDDMDSDIPF